ncbi:hypothetical protein TrVE_jg5657 [Triparma verrucosa]|uniref:Uncharacterized protein n=1 Tax=Triparma verrucosa TaxID=1606542 RepID=A0A9W7KXV9_9STRA|nr:hypothetical protein TrVE_jg5657 [Triparma verrucosa]
MVRFRPDGTTAGGESSSDDDADPRPLHSTDVVPSNHDASDSYDDFEAYSYEPQRQVGLGFGWWALALVPSLLCAYYYFVVIDRGGGGGGVFSDSLLQTRMEQPVCPETCRWRSDDEMKVKIGADEGNLKQIQSPKLVRRIFDRVYRWVDAGDSGVPLLLGFAGPVGTGKSSAAVEIAKGILVGGGCVCDAEREEVAEEGGVGMGVEVGVSVIDDAIGVIYQYLDSVRLRLLGARARTVSLTSRPPPAHDHFLGIHGLLNVQVAELSTPTLFKRRIISHLMTCANGFGVVVLENFERADRNVVLALSDMIEEVGKTGRITYFSDADNSSLSVKVGRLGFVLVTDIGSDKIVREFVSGGGVGLVGGGKLEESLIDAFEERFTGEDAVSDWKGGGLRSLPLSSTLDLFPFSPLTPANVGALIRYKLTEMEQEGRARKIWNKLITDDIVVENLLSNMRGFVTGGKVVFNKYGAKELAGNAVLQGIAAAVRKRRMRKGGVVGRLKMDGGDGNGEGGGGGGGTKVVVLEICRVEGGCDEIFRRSIA